MSSLVLVTGGAGYIGSHVTVALLENGFDVIVFDNLSNSSKCSIDRVVELTGRTVVFIEGDVCDREALSCLFADYPIFSVIHCAGLKAVAESVREPCRYYANNVAGTLNLLDVMRGAGVHNLVFSSSATVYGASQQMPLSEASPTQMPANPYGRTKLMVEEILRDLAAADEAWRFAIVRYFNPVGAHESGRIGEDPLGIPSNLVPFISQVAVGKLRELHIFGADYETVDGTGVRDYIHVMDLAAGHLKALERINLESGLSIWNFGTGKGYSVLELIQAFERASGVKIPYRTVERRPGDIAECWADISKATRELDWYPEKNLHDMMVDTWRWQSNNPNGYR